MRHKAFKYLSLFIVVFAIVTVVPQKIITFDRYIVNIVFLTLISTFLIYSFADVFKKIQKDIGTVRILDIVTLSLLLHGLVCFSILHYIGREYFPFNISGVSFLLMDKFFFFAKPIEIFIQQILITVLVRKLSDLGMSLRHIITTFVFGFGMIHIFQVFRTGVYIGLGFTVFAIIASFIFPYFVLKVKNGIMYNFMIHLGVYDIVAILFYLYF